MEHTTTTGYVYVIRENGKGIEEHKVEIFQDEDSYLNEYFLELPELWEEGTAYSFTVGEVSHKAFWENKKVKFEYFVLLLLDQNKEKARSLFVEEKKVKEESLRLYYEEEINKLETKYSALNEGITKE